MSATARVPGPTSSPWARFDDLRSGTALLFGATSDTLAAWAPDEVPAVLDRVQRAADGGAWTFGFVSYEAAAGLDSALPVHDPVDGLPLAWFAISAAPPVTVPVVGPASAAAVRTAPWRLRWDQDHHRAAVDAVRERIAAGEAYQVNLTTRTDSTLHGDPFALYAHLAGTQHGAHHAYLHTGRFVIAGASPELFFDLRGRRIRMRPMKGTAPRGRTAEEDEALRRQLRSSAKERAENLMIVDLVRNDLSRIATTGSVRVTALFTEERYDTVHQLTSEVTAELEHGVELTDIFRALFPCGSVTGAPKQRSMAIIRELEPLPRGVYCGAVGLVAPPGAAQRTRFSVAIRTALVDRRYGRCTYGAGGGITWGSDADREFDELVTKTRILPTPPHAEPGVLARGA